MAISGKPTSGRNNFRTTAIQAQSAVAGSLLAPVVQ